MSLSNSINNLNYSSNLSSQIIYQQNSNILLNNENNSIIDHSVSDNRLYERSDGSIALAEKPIGYIIGEQILAPAIDVLSSLAKNTFNFIGNGFSYLSSGLSDAYHFQILPGASAQIFTSLLESHFLKMRLKDEIQSILQSIQNRCKVCIEKLKEVPGVPNLNFARWEELNSQIDLHSSNGNIGEILKNIDNRILFVEERKKSLIKHSLLIHKFLDLLSDTIHQIERDLQIAKSKEKELTENDFFFGGGLLDQILIDTTLLVRLLIPLLIDTKLLVRLLIPPTNLVEVGNWIENGYKVKDSIYLARSNLEKEIVYCDDMITPLFKLRINIEEKKIDILMSSTSDLKMILDKCKTLLLK